MKFSRILHERMTTVQHIQIQNHGLYIAILVLCLIPVIIVAENVDKSSTSSSGKQGYPGNFKIP